MAVKKYPMEKDLIDTRKWKSAGSGKLTLTSKIKFILDKMRKTSIMENYHF